MACPPWLIWLGQFIMNELTVLYEWVYAWGSMVSKGRFKFDNSSIYFLKFVETYVTVTLTYQQGLHSKSFAYTWSDVYIGLLRLESKIPVVENRGSENSESHAGHSVLHYWNIAGPNKNQPVWKILTIRFFISGFLFIPMYMMYLYFLI